MTDSALRNRGRRRRRRESASHPPPPPARCRHISAFRNPNLAQATAAVSAEMGTSLASLSGDGVWRRHLMATAAGVGAGLRRFAPLLQGCVPIPAIQLKPNACRGQILSHWRLPLHLCGFYSMSVSIVNARRLVVLCEGYGSIWDLSGVRDSGLMGGEWCQGGQRRRGQRRWRAHWSGWSGWSENEPRKPRE